MKKLLRIIFTTAILCLFFVPASIASDDFMNYRESEYSLIHTLEKVDKDEEVSIKVKEPRKLKNVRVCFLLDEINTTTEEISNIFSEVDVVMARAFGDDAKGYRDIRNTPPDFVKGYIQDKKNNIYELHGMRMLMTEWRFLNGGVDHHIVYSVYACTHIQGNPEIIKSINFTSLYDFDTKGLFFYYEY